MKSILLSFFKKTSCPVLWKWRLMLEVSVRSYFWHKFIAKNDLSTTAKGISTTKCLSYPPANRSYKIGWELLVANGSLGAFHIFCNVAPLSADPITGRVDVTRSVRSPSWPSGGRLRVCPFSGSTQEPLLVIQKASGRFHRTRQHNLAEIWLDKNLYHNIQHWKRCNQVDLMWLEENRLANNFIYIFPKTTNEFQFSMFWPAEKASLALTAHHWPGIYLLGLIFPSLLYTKALRLRNLPNAKKGPGMWRNTEEMLKHCIFNKPCQICSEPTACKQCAQPPVCILNMSNKLCAGMWLLHRLEQDI